MTQNNQKNGIGQSQSQSQSQKAASVRFRRFCLALLCIMLAVSLESSLLACAGSTEQESADTPEATDTEATTLEEATPVELQIFAANSLERALPEVQALYSAANPHVTFKDTQFKGSGDLVTELVGGAPADILITASAATMDTASENGNIDASSRVEMFTNDLIIVRQAGSNINITSLEDVNSAAITRVAIGDSDAVPAGAYANQSLFSVGLYSDASGKGGTYLEGFDVKVILQASVGNVAKTVSTGDVQIGFVYSSDLYRYDGIEQAFVVPASTHKPIVYPGAVVAGSANAEEAARFLDFCLNDPEALKIWAQYGFELL